MTKARLIFALCFVCAFGAGVCAGMVWQRMHPPPHDHFAELHLTDQQREQMREIWTEMTKKMDWQAQHDKRDAARKERDAALQALVTPEQKPRYDEIMAAYQKKMDDLAAEAKKWRDEADARTEAILSDSQRVIFRELRKKRMDGHGGPHGHGEMPPPPPGEGGPPPGPPPGP